MSDAWVAKVRAKDTVWVLGDLALANPTYALSVLAPLPGIKNLVWGNHDRGWPAHRNAHTQARPYMDVFASVQAFARRRIDGAEVMLSHFPYDGDSVMRAPQTAASRVTLVDAGPEWRPVGVEGYFANREGQVLGRFGRVLKPWIAGSGYEYIAVPTGGTGKRNVTVHSLVCTAFHGPRPDGMQVAHNDGNPTNNRAENLRWTTPADNSADRRRHGTAWASGYSRPGELNPGSKLTASEVAAIRSSTEPAHLLAGAFGVGRSAIDDIRNGRTWKNVGDKRDGDTDGRPVDRHEQYRLRDLGLPLIHGHTHSTKFLTASERGSLQLHVGFDAHRRMVSLEEVAAQLAGGTMGAAPSRRASPARSCAHT
ncbi:HNH endonuclease [Oerskovia enterophila]|uniref:HNH endonuclease n=1 Tax=Oerskovia enterophila TaxID=43678 RepID=UPI00200D928D|nr:HNH endonuclease [Oerskovia enterophila]